MSSLKEKTRQFKLDFADWEWLLKEDGETQDGINEIKEYIKSIWHEEEERDYWISFVAERAAFRRELINMGKRICGK